LIPKNTALSVIVIALGVLFLSFQFNNSPEEISKIQGKIMGTTFTISFYGESTDSLENSVSLILNSVNSDMSTYLEDSLISKFNKSKINTWNKVNEDFINLLAYAQNLCSRTSGVYDVTIGKLVNRWGFGPDQASLRPKSEQLEYLTKQIGCDAVFIDIDNKSIKKTKDIALDFSSIAKGHAIDKVYDFLTAEKNIKNVFIELGGEVRTSKFKKGSKPWKVGVINPNNNSKVIHTFLSNEHETFAMATSGDYRNLRIFDDQQFSHTINPKSGLPNLIGKKSVSVISDNAMKADALATALNVMPLDEAMIFADINKIKALFIIEGDKKPKLLFSQELQKGKI
tara:strand:- start:92 stop:1114 length:1023 start_codon:yes stop_codon:yes gene_type:complete